MIKLRSKATPKPVWSAQTGSLADLAIAGPAISKWAHLVSLFTNLNKKAAAEDAPPHLVLPVLDISPYAPFIVSLCSSWIGKCQTGSND